MVNQSPNDTNVNGSSLLRELRLCEGDDESAEKRKDARQSVALFVDHIYTYQHMDTGPRATIAMMHCEKWLHGLREHHSVDVQLSAWSSATR